ncbi:ribonuclease III [Neorickettsia helminthoeca str. Oregon]|uniref:Ribonuclease 3 n=1 Tax=Neorickettsia helminthoeca str. Oregon TaxID=1286528 RepID=X5H523_9RICK|nr:ribonuclease III [Neorickettsia helminthoeca]AHX11793.1 ribonuclease III [Neorickettsia helminthoeca str. Oregon]
MELDKLEALIGIRFKNKTLLIESLTHPSMEVNFSYERLEFLGDAVLDMVIASILYELFPNDPEGSLSNRQSSLVCRDTLAMIARKIDLGKYIFFSSSEELCGGREKVSNLENALEALIGAIFLDSGIDTATRFIKEYWYDLAVKSSPTAANPKSILQELLQARGMEPPTYKVIGRTGPDHQPIFEVEVRVDSKVEKAFGTSKKASEENAARAMIKRLAPDT